MKVLTTFLATLALSTTLSFAADEAKPAEAPKAPAAAPEAGKPKHDPAEMFKKLDTNADGAVSLEEFKASPRGKKDPEKADETFKKLDTNADGKLSLEEFSAARGPKKGEKKAKQ